MSDLARALPPLRLADERIDELARETVVRMIGQPTRKGSEYIAEVARVIRLALAEASACS